MASFYLKSLLCDSDIPRLISPLLQWLSACQFTTVSNLTQLIGMFRSYVKGAVVYDTNVGYIA